MAFGPLKMAALCGRTVHFSGKRQKASPPRSSAGLPDFNHLTAVALILRFSI
jgi:hypothetical protein